MSKSCAPTFSMETVDGRTLRVAVCRAENVGQQGSPDFWHNQHRKRSSDVVHGEVA
jgi:hypothetical protein